jgi:3D (Asp-Asp-Asp) domain-containing protein
MIKLRDWIEVIVIAVIFLILFLIPLPERTEKATPTPTPTATIKATPKRQNANTTSRHDSRFEYRVVSAYSLPGIMASGKRVYDGAIAASRSIPFGTKIRIRGKIYTVEDRLSLKYDDRIDIWMPNEADCIKWGVPTIKVEILGR